MAKGKYQEWLTEDGLLILKGWARDGKTDIEIAQLMGISRATLYDWFNRYPDIFDTIKKGRKPLNVILEDTFYEKKLNGYYVDEETSEVTIQKDADNKIIGTTEHRRKNRRYIPPDTTAMIFMLKCRMAQKYNDKPITDNDTTALDKLDEIITNLKNTAEKSGGEK